MIYLDNFTGIGTSLVGNCLQINVDFLIRTDTDIMEK